jgi:hypothetical protein
MRAVEDTRPAGTSTIPASPTRDAWRARLREAPDRDALLLAESRLPGPRANLELAHAAAEELSPEDIRRLAALDPDAAPAGTAAEFLPVCGAIGLGRLAAEGAPDAPGLLRSLASDPRWRVREGVAMGLQRLGDVDPEAMRALATALVRGGALERRAAVAAICEPRLLADPLTARAALALLDAAMLGLVDEPDRRRDDVRVVRRALGYCWSVAVVALPEEGKPALERWLDCRDPDVRWVLRENLRKNRLLRAEPAFTRACLERLTTPGRR